MRALVPDPAPIQPSKVEIVKLEFAFEKLEMEQKYLRFQKVVDKAESNTCIHERKAQKMIEIYTKAKSENENLCITNKKL